MSDQEITQRLQNIVDKGKTVATLNNIHNLSPPINRGNEDQAQITIIKALESAPRLQELFLEARGLVWDPKKKEFIQLSSPYMNIDGAKKLVDVCKRIAQEAEWSNFQEEDIPSYVTHFYAENLPYFTFWHEDYELDPRNFNFVMTTLKMFILGSFSKGKRGKFLNVVGRTYSEEFLGKVMQDQNQANKEGFLVRNNPFRRMTNG